MISEGGLSIRDRANFAPAITAYLTESDQRAFDGVDPETPGRVKQILDASSGAAE